MWVNVYFSFGCRVTIILGITVRIESRQARLVMTEKKLNIFWNIDYLLVCGKGVKNKTRFFTISHAFFHFFINSFFFQVKIDRFLLQLFVLICFCFVFLKAFLSYMSYYIAHAWIDLMNNNYFARLKKLISCNRLGYR